MQASCDQLLAAVKLLFTVLRWSEPEAEEIFVGVPPPNKLVGVPDLELKSFLSHFFSSCHGGGLEEEGGKGFCCSILSACPWSPSFAANGWGSWCREHHQILATAPLHLLVERRPLGVLATTSGSCISSWPPSHMGGSLSGSLSWYFHGLPPVVCRRCCSHSFTPSGFVPGGGGIGPGSKTAKRTRLLFSFAVWGPIYKNVGPGL